MSQPRRVMSHVSNVIGYPVKSYRNIPAPIRMLSGGIFVNRAGGFVLSFLALILTIRHYPAGQIGVILILSGVCGIVGSWLGGALIPRLGTRWTLFLTMITSGIFTAALIPSSPFPVTVAIVAVVATVNRAYIPVSATMVGNLSRPDQRVQVYAFFQLSLNTGAVVGPAVAGFLLTHSLTVLLLVDAATSVCFALLGLRVRADDQLSQSEPAAPVTQRMPGRVRNDWRYLLACVAVGLVFVAYQQTSGPLPLVFRDHHYNLQLLGYLFSGSAIASVLLVMPISHITRKFPLWMPLAVGALFVGGAYSVLLINFSPPFLVATFAMVTLGDMIVCPLAMVVATMMSTDRTHASYQAAYTVARTAGVAGGPAIGVFAYSVHVSIVWWGAGLLGVIAAGLFFVGLRHLPRPDGSTASGGCSPTTAARQRQDGADHDRSAVAK